MTHTTPADNKRFASVGMYARGKFCENFKVPVRTFVFPRQNAKQLDDNKLFNCN